MVNGTSLQRINTDSPAMPAPSKLGISPCLIVPAKARMMYLASWKRSVSNISPLNDINVSLPQLRNIPLAK